MGSHRAVEAGAQVVVASPACAAPPGGPGRGVDAAGGQVVPVDAEGGAGASLAVPHRAHLLVAAAHRSSKALAMAVTVGQGYGATRRLPPLSGWSHSRHTYSVSVSPQQPHGCTPALPWQSGHGSS